MFHKKSIDEWSLKYWLLQQYMRLAYWLYFRKVESVNRSNLPLKMPVLLAPNHQNALMDALAFVYDTGLQPVFLARADIFKGKAIIGILNYLNIMPIFRIRDGISNVRRNDEVFEKSLRVIHNKHNPLCIFPEGNHGDKRRLRPLVKGIFRIALMAQEAYGDELAVKIVPVGVDYGHYQKFRTTLFLNYGEPIEISEFYQLWKNNNVDAVNRLRERLAEDLEKLMINITTVDYYDLYMNLRVIYNAPMKNQMGIHDNSLAGRFRADKKMIQLLDNTLETKPGNIASLNKDMNEYQALLKQYNFRDWVIAKGKFSLPAILASATLLLLTLPIFVYGFIANILPYSIPVRIARAKVKDTQFHSTFKFVLAMILFPVMYLILMIPGFCLIDNIWMRLAFVLSLPLSGMAAYCFYIHHKKVRSRFRFFRMKFTRNQNIDKLLALRKSIMNKMDQIVLNPVEL
ncbi:MAG: 1-acyl-sn-glycerol-3-phosphate acyltransferase [Bacteroidales bacterium]|nr:1-acyl-sn-glycerol-3-phosphate acyltransferase [Bacteroidales bacterium]MBN2762617.1 1-acyl-sn-glycerol-3-phosphate acyltransferase [Bacteroidales bacterium]